MSGACPAPRRHRWRCWLRHPDAPRRAACCVCENPPPPRGLAALVGARALARQRCQHPHVRTAPAWRDLLGPAWRWCADCGLSLGDLPLHPVDTSRKA